MPTMSIHTVVVGDRSFHLHHALRLAAGQRSPNPRVAGSPRPAALRAAAAAARGTWRDGTLAWCGVGTTTLVGSSYVRRRKHRRASRQPMRAATSAPSPLSQDEFDVAVLGAGPAGVLMAYLLAEQQGLKVCLIDPNASKKWPNNYGVWIEEWTALGQKLGMDLSDCLGSEWPITDCYFGGSWGKPVDDRLRLDRAYGRVDRLKLKEKLCSSRVEIVEELADIRSIASNIYAGDSLRHDATGSTLRLNSGRQLRARLLVDATGSESRITRRHPGTGEPDVPLPGFQIAWGFEGIVEGNTHYDPKAMTLFDYRTDHLSFDPAWEKDAIANPTFMYVMPLGAEPGFGGGQRVFFEETSLVARPGMSFEECKRRCFARLKHLGVSIRPGSIEDEEFCYIPMGGALPEPGQRIVAFGGAAATVHPSTGYQLCRMMASSVDVAQVIGREFAKGAAFQPDAAAAAAYQAIWSPENQAQREFAVFGGEFLMSVDVRVLRAWFDGFFRLPEPLWGGFLAGWPSLPGNVNHESWWARLQFGLQLIVKLPFPVAAKLVFAIIGFSVEYYPILFRSVTPFFGAPAAYTWQPEVPPDEVGDPVAKREAREMIAAGKAAVE